MASSSEKRGEPERAGLQAAVARLWTAGVELEREAFGGVDTGVDLDLEALYRPAEQGETPTPWQEAAADEGSRGKRNALEGEAQEAIAAVWEEVLGAAPASRSADFFEFGGDSLAATRVVARLGARLGVEVSLDLLLETPRLDRFAERVSGLRGASAPPPMLLPAARSGDRVPLSSGQRRLWLLDRLSASGAAYNIPLALRFDGDLDPAALAAALAAVVRRHEVLRTTYREEEGEVVGVVVPRLPDRLPRLDLSGLPRGERSVLLERLERRAGRRVFDLAAGPPLFRVLVRIGERRWTLLLVLHHIAFDGWSRAVLADEIAGLYRPARPASAPDSGPPALPVQFADHAAWQRRLLSSGQLDAELERWRGRLEGLATLELPTDRPRPIEPSGRGGRVRFALDAVRTAALGQAALAFGATPFMVLLAAFMALLARLSRGLDIAVGSPIAGRRRPEVEPLIGFFVNTVVLRCQVRPDATGGALVESAREAARASFADQDLPFGALVEGLGAHREPGRHPLFQAMFALQSFPPPEARLPGCDLKLERLDNGTAKVDLVLELTPVGATLDGHLEYATDLFDRTTVTRWGGHLSALLAGLIANPDRPVAELSLLDPGERHQLRCELNDTATSRTDATPVDRSVVRVAGEAPARIALVENECHLSYGELVRRARVLAAALRRAGIGPEARVGLDFGRSLELWTAALAVLLADGAYLPLDPAYPVERRAAMAADAEVAALVGPPGSELSTVPELRSVPALVLAGGDLTPGRAARGAGPRPRPALRRGDPVGGEVCRLAYVIYTSGSTGRPKGVAVEHRALLNLARWHQRVFRIASSDRATQLAGPSFDAAVWEVWPYLDAGARVEIPAAGILTAGPGLVGWLAARSITVSFLPTPLAEILLAERWPRRLALRALLTGGDRLHRPPRPGLPFRVFNQYGPTENAVVATWMPLAPGGDEPAIGWPIDNVRAHVAVSIGVRPAADAPIGVPGELMVGGRSLARGYLGRPALTAESFVPDPYGGSAGGRLYRTGDLVRWRPDGALEFLGRIDQQVQVRGMRVEPGEIEGVLNRLAEVREAAVVWCERNGGPGRLVAFAAVHDGDGDGASLKRELGRRLPAHMVPEVVLREELPLTPNGKIDRRRLRELALAFEPAATVEPRTQAEEAMLRLWQELLGRADIGPEDDFFELGGDSLLAVRLLFRISEEFAVDLPAGAAFSEPTVAGLALRLEQAILEDLEAESGAATLAAVEET